MMFPSHLRVFIWSALLLLAGCATISQFDHHAYIHTIDAKVEALNVMGLATEDYGAHRQEIREVQKALDKIYEYERNRRNNEITLALWDKLRDTSGHLWGGFVKRWRDEGMLRPVFIREITPQVAEAFDVIAQLESKKIKPKDVK